MRKADDAVRETRAGARDPKSSRGAPMRPLTAALAMACAAAAVGCSSPVEQPRPSAALDQLPRRLTTPEPQLIREAQEQALEAFNTPDNNEAIELYKNAANTYPEHPAVWNNLGVRLMQEDRYLEADEAFARASELAPEDARPVYNRALLQMNRRYPRRALPYFDEALKRDPNHLGALRGAIRAEVMLRVASDQTLERIARAMMLEQNERWRRFYETERSKIEASLGLDER